MAAIVMGQLVHLPGDLNKHNKALTQFSMWVSGYTFGGKLESAQQISNTVQQNSKFEDVPFGGVYVTGIYLLACQVRMTKCHPGFVAFRPLPFFVHSAQQL